MITSNYNNNNDTNSKNNDINWASIICHNQNAL